MIWLVLLAAAWTAPVAAQDQPAEGPTVDILAAAVAHEDRRLLTGCQPVYLDLELEDDKRSTDLTVDRIRTMAESRLRASRLLADGGGPHSSDQERALLRWSLLGLFSS